MKKIVKIFFIVSLFTLVPALVQAAPSDHFVITVKTDNPGISSSTSITLPIVTSGTNYDVDWNGDGTFDEFALTGNATHDYGVAGTYTIRLDRVTRMNFNNTGDKAKILSVEQWGTTAWTDMVGMFYGCINLVINASDTPNLSVVTSLQDMFRGATSFNNDISAWDISNINNLTRTFRDATSFDQPLNAWDTSAVTNMSGMFTGAIDFNQSLSLWDVSLVTNMSAMFQNADSFNQSLNTWNTSSLRNAQGIFQGADVFNGNITNWNTSDVTTFTNAFAFAAAFDQDLSYKAGLGTGGGDAWDTSSLLTAIDAFRSTPFDQDISSWNVESVTSLSGMFNGVTLSTDNYDALLIGWNDQNLPSSISFHGGNSDWCLGDSARTNMTTVDLWSITDGDLDCTGVNQFPTDIQIDAGNTDTQDENTAANTNIGTLTTTDPDGGDTHSYSLACTTPGADDSHFNISADQLRNTTVFDFENPVDIGTDNVYEVCVRTTDSGTPNRIYDELLTITINDANDAPSDIQIDAGNTDTQDENTAADSSIGTLSTVDQDGTDTHTYSLACTTPGADDAHFNISADQLRNTTVFDFENPVDANTDNVYNLCVRVTDSGAPARSYDENLSVTVNDVFEAAPSSTSSTSGGTRKVSAKKISQLFAQARGEQVSENSLEDNPLGGERCSEDLIVYDAMKQGDRNGQYGSYNADTVGDVALLQTHMNRLLLDEYGNQAAGPVDGIYGPLTKQGVERLQLRLNQLLPEMTPLVIDGIVGPFTREAINYSC